MAANRHQFPFGMRDVTELLKLPIQHTSGNSAYVNCPFCGDTRGRMNIHYTKETWRCNHCEEAGGMLALYAKFYGVSNAGAYRAILAALPINHTETAYAPKPYPPLKIATELPQSPPASAEQVHQTYRCLLNMLTLQHRHCSHLQSEKRGLSDAQIRYLGYKSMPPAYLGRYYAEELAKRGCTIQGVPGFYQQENGEWALHTKKCTAGILLPVSGIDGRICGMQILLDTPIRSKNHSPDKKGAKYIWLSSASKPMGITSGSPVHVLGSPFSKTVYVTEGILKSGIAHCLLDRTFIAVAGVSCTAKLDNLFALLKANGTELIIEAFDMDKFVNEHVSRGVSRVYTLAQKNGLLCRRLTWNPAQKGIDDFAIAQMMKKSLQGTGT